MRNSSEDRPLTQVAVAYGAPPDVVVFRYRDEHGDLLHLRVVGQPEMAVDATVLDTAMRRAEVPIFPVTATVGEMVRTLLR